MLMVLQLGIVDAAVSLVWQIKLTHIIVIHDMLRGQKQ